MRRERERSKIPVVGRGMVVRKTIFHFPLRGQSTRAASLRGFLQISSPVSSVSPLWPVEARWQLQLIAQPRLVWKECERGVRTRLSEDERRLALESKEELCKCPSQHPPAYVPTRDGKEPTSAKANEKKNVLFFYRFFEVLLLEPGICLLFISPLEAHQFVFAGSEAEIPPQGGL